MNKEIKYSCVLDGEMELINSELFDSFEEAKKAGIKEVKEFNKNLLEGNYIDMGYSEILDCNLDNVKEPIKKFLIVKCVPPEIPNDLGKVILDYVDENTEIGELFYLNNSGFITDKISKFEVNRLNSIVYNFLDTNLGNIGYFIEEETVIYVE